MRPKNCADFGCTPDGTPVHLLTLKSEVLSCTLVTLGAALRSLLVPNRTGRPVDVVLGCDSSADYLASPDYLGAIVGRYANRIGDGQFYLNGRLCHLTVNSGKNHIHGGFRGFSHRVWNLVKLSGTQAILALDSPDGEEGYPGTLHARVTYALEGCSLSIRYEAACDADTVCNLTNHAYFNLSGHASGCAMGQWAAVFADRYLPTGPDGIPVGPPQDVAGSPMDLRKLTPLESRVDAAFFQLRQSGGFDHCFVINGRSGQLRPAAKAFSPATGITMAIETTLPGIQLYTANGLETGRRGKGGICYGPRHAFCLETQFFPDSPNRPDFPSAFLQAGRQYDHKTVYRF